MTKKDLIISVLVGLLLGVGAFQVGLVPSIAPAGAQGSGPYISPLPERALTKDSSVEEILSLMLESHKKWHTLQAETRYQFKDPYGAEPDYIVKQDFWLSSDGKARLEMSRPEEPPFLIWTSDGSTIIEQDEDKEQFFVQSVPSAFRSPESFDPRSSIAESADTIYVNHPFALIDSSLKDWLVPTGVAQTMIFDLQHPDRTVEVVGTEKVAGREALVLLRLPKRHMYWVDAETGVIIRAEYLRRGTEEIVDDWVMRFEVTSIQYDLSLKQDLFSISPNPEFREVSSFEFYEGFPEEQLRVPVP